MPTYEYDLDEMTEFVAALDRSIEEITTHCDNARTSVAAVLDHYSGSAATAFTGFHDSWQDTARAPDTWETYDAVAPVIQEAYEIFRHGGN